MIALRFTRRFSMAHRLISGASKTCMTPHGHNELVIVDMVPRAARKLDGSTNMVVEFSAAKKRWHRFVDQRLDHALQLSATDPLLKVAETQFPDWRLVVTPGDPTTELLTALLASKCQAILDHERTGLRVARVELQETPTNTVVLEGDPRELLPPGQGWWTRPDETTR